MELAFSIFGFFGFILALMAWHKVSNLEKELKRKQLIDERFASDR